LAKPIDLVKGTYAVVVYGLNSVDPYGDGGDTPPPGSGVAHAGFDPFEFTTAASPAFPKGGDNNDHSSASFRFEGTIVPTLKIMPLGDSITDGEGGTNAGYRKALYDLLVAAKVSFQFVGSAFDNPGMLPPEQTHHEGHSGFTIAAGTSGRSGISDNIG